MQPQEAQQQVLSKLLQLLQQQQQHVAARSGFLLALAALPPQVYRLALKQQQQQQQQQHHGQQQPLLLALLLEEATALSPLGSQGLNDPYARRHALLALAFLIESVSPAHAKEHAAAADDAADDDAAAAAVGAASAAASAATAEAKEAAAAAATIDWEAILRCLYSCVADFSTDRRGDVGSWIREVAAEVAALILESFPYCCCSSSTNSSSSNSSSSSTALPDCQLSEYPELPQPQQHHQQQQQQQQQEQEQQQKLGPEVHQRQQLLHLLLRLSFEGLTRTRSRASFLLSRLVAPMTADSSRMQRFKVNTRP